MGHPARNESVESNRIGADRPGQPKNEASGCATINDLHWAKGLVWAKNGHKQALRRVANKKGLRSVVEILNLSPTQRRYRPTQPEELDRDTIPHSLWGSRVLFGVNNGITGKNAVPQV